MVERIEDGYGLDMVRDLNQMDIEYINDEVVIFRCIVENKIKYFFLNKEGCDGVSMPFKNFSSFLTIPVSFSKRNPGDLNKINFKYYQDKDEDVLMPIKIIYGKEVKEFDFEDVDGKTRNISAYKIETLIKGKTKDLIEVAYIPNEIPLLHKILKNVKKEIELINSEIKIKLHSYILGYDGFNKGRHFIRLVFDYNQEYITIENEMYQFGLDIETDFSGIGKDAKTVFIMPTLFRVAGETAFNVPFTKEQFLKIMKDHIEVKLSGEKVETENLDLMKGVYI